MELYLGFFKSAEPGMHPVSLLSLRPCQN
ncbi:maker594 [Drosophila busckii]|uniref:Maker594 n=1 Tax=Drosophila busckii TaxID=30019 RepID=A0A0M4ESS1_DROBS|nr:maker594 [Drosophila busckii]